MRANPDLLHWQAVVPSPVLAGTPVLLSPRYEEVVAEGQVEGKEQTRPPSYVTRASPARRRDGDGGEDEGEAGCSNLQARVDDSGSAHMHARVDDAEPEPEMVEVRGIGFAV